MGWKRISGKGEFGGVTQLKLPLTEVVPQLPLDVNRQKALCVAAGFITSLKAMPIVAPGATCVAPALG